MHLRHRVRPLRATRSPEGRLPPRAGPAPPRRRLACAHLGPESIDETCEAIVGTIDADVLFAERAAATAALRECDRKIDRYRRLLETGTDHALVGQWITELQAEQSRAETMLRQLTSATPADLATAAEVRPIVEDVGGLMGLLQVSQPTLRSPVVRCRDEVGVVRGQGADKSRTSDTSMRQLGYIMLAG